MYNGLPWTLLLVLQFLTVISHPIENHYNTNIDVGSDQFYGQETKENTADEKIISVRITSSVAVGRQNGRTLKNSNNKNKGKTNISYSRSPNLEKTLTTTPNITLSEDKQSEIPSDLVGANIEFIKQLYAKKETKDHHSENVHPFQAHIQNHRHEDFLIKDITTISSLEESMSSNGKNVKKHSDSKININHSDNLLNPSNSTYFLENSEVNKSKKSDEILVHSATKLVLDYTSDDIKNDGIVEEDSSSFIIGEQRIANMSKLQKYRNPNYSYDNIAESSINSFRRNSNNENIDQYEDIENVPLARSVSVPRGAQNNIINIKSETTLGRSPKSQVTNIRFSIIHEAPKDLEHMNNNNGPTSPSHVGMQNKLEYPIVYSEPAKIYSEPAKVYSEPAKVYSEPAKVYSEPSKVYSEPAKIYSEPAKVYSEPAKFYSEPASLHLPNEQNAPMFLSSTTMHTTPIIDTSPTTYPIRSSGVKPENNYEVGEDFNVHDGEHVEQESSTEKCQQDNCKVGYVVEGRQFKKYRVEERTSDGFIVGEYGVVRNEDGALRGVRYTADSDASPRLIYDALMKFLQLK